ncbi:MAG: hypothetical protein ACRDE5_14855 [Ginsengibacter sp.]
MKRIAKEDEIYVGKSVQKIRKPDGNPALFFLIQYPMKNQPPYSKNCAVFFGTYKIEKCGIFHPSF